MTPRGPHLKNYLTGTSLPKPRVFFLPYTEDHTLTHLFLHSGTKARYAVPGPFMHDGFLGAPPDTILG